MIVEIFNFVKSNFFTSVLNTCIGNCPRHSNKILPQTFSIDTELFMRVRCAHNYYYIKRKFKNLFFIVDEVDGVDNTYDLDDFNDDNNLVYFFLLHFSNYFDGFYNLLQTKV